MEERLRELEKAVAVILDRLQRIESRLGVQKESPSETPATRVIQASGNADELLPGAVVTRTLQLIGRTCLVLGGAFLIRALTDGRVLSLGVGIALALVLATASLAFSYRAGSLENRPSAAFHGLSAALIAYPLALETTTRLGAMSPLTAAAVVAVITAMMLLIAWRHRFVGLAWVAVVSCLATSIALMQATGGTNELNLLLLLLTAATLGLAESRSWNGPRWPAALLLDAVILRSTLSAAHDSQGVSDRLLAGFIFSMLVMLLSLAAIAYRTLVRRKPVTAFHAVQTFAGLTIGVVAAVYYSAAHDTGTIGAGVAALAISAMASYVALSVVPKRGPARTDYLFYLAMSAGLLFVGGVLAIGGALRGLLWASVGLGVAVLGRRLERISLLAYGALFIWAAAATSGLLDAVSDGFLGGVQRWRPPGAAALVVLGLALAAYAVTATSSRQPTVRASIARLPASAILLLCAIGFGALVVHVGRALIGIHVEDHAFLATGRTVALVAVATLVALGYRRLHWVELGWIAYFLLGLGGIKLVVEDLPNGRALTLLVAFAAYGIALIAIQKLVRPSHERPGRPGASATATRQA